MSNKLELTKNISISKLDKLGFRGIDVSIDDSILDYSLVWKLENSKKGIYMFYYGVANGPCGEGTTRIDWGRLSKKELAELFDFNGGHIVAEEFFAFVDYSLCNFDKWLENFPQCVYDVVSWTGYENVFGTSNGGVELIRFIPEDFETREEYERAVS